MLNNRIATRGMIFLALALTVIANAAEYRVEDYGAVADGKTDNTAAFQKALDAASQVSGGVVKVPVGRYRFEGVLTIPAEVQLVGEYVYAPAHAGIRDRNPKERPDFGTVLLPTSGRGEEDGTPFITQQTNSALRGVSIYYPDQDAQAETPTPYPWAVALRGNNSAIIDVELLNPYKGIDASHNQRVLIRNVHGQPIFLGIWVDQVYDIGRIENVHWNPWWSIGTPIFKWQMEHGTAFKFGRTDWHYVMNTFCFGYGIGYHFTETEKGATNGNFLGIGADNCNTAVRVDQSAPFGILITNGEFVSFEGPEPTMVRVGPDHIGSVRFVNCAFWGPCDRNAFIEGNGTVGFSDCTFVQWGRKERETHAIHVEGGSVLIRGCEFKEKKKPEIYLGEGVKRAIVTGNFVRDAVQITNKSGGKVVLRDNLGM